MVYQKLGEIGYLGGEPGFGKTAAYPAALAGHPPEARDFGLHALKSDLLILIVSAYCSGLRCSPFNLN